MIPDCQENRLSINVRKTKGVFYPHSSNVSNNINHEIEINDQTVNYVQLFLFLGVDIDEHTSLKGNSAIKDMTFR